MSDDLKGYESGPLDPEERRAVRRDEKRVAVLWSKFGGEDGDNLILVGRLFAPMARLVRDWKFWGVALAITAWLNRPEIADALQVLIGSAS